MAALAPASCGAAPDQPARSAGVRPHKTTAHHRAVAGLPSPAAQTAAVRRFARLGRPIYCGGRHRRLVALTFDDGPGRYTPLALRELRSAGARATFFLVGRSIAGHPAEARRERGLAAIGDHTSTHAYLPGLTPDAAVAEIAEGQAAARRATGRAVSLFRPPFGGHTRATDRAVRLHGMAEIIWDVDSGDAWTSPPQSYRAISARVRRHIRPGSIVLMHENRGQTIRALRTILPFLRRRGLRAVTVPELLAADPPSRAVLAAGAAGCGVRLPPGV